VRDSKNRDIDAEGIGSQIKLEDEVDALFKLPLADFIGARNDLAARLKRGGRANDANLVKALAKPSVSAWAVNQLHWNHREEFDHLLAAGRRVRDAQTSRTAGNIADMRGLLETRSEALSHLSKLASSILYDAGHNPTPDTIQRITIDLEALSAYASLSDSPTPGRLTRDLDPPGFGSLVSLMEGALTTASDEPTRVTPSPKPASAAPRQKASSSGDPQKARRLEENHQAAIAAAKVSLRDAKRLLTEASVRVERLGAARKTADAEAQRAEKELRQSEERFRKASAASRDAAERRQSIAAEAKEAAWAVEDAERNQGKASKELESLLRKSPARQRNNP
jgi:hypothetical protein